MAESHVSRCNKLIANRILSNVGNIYNRGVRCWQDLVQLRAQITDQQDKIKELMAQNVKLNAQVRIGQDSLQAEQGLVTELQEEIAKKVCPCQQALPNYVSSYDWSLLISFTVNVRLQLGSLPQLHNVLLQ